MLHGTGRQGHNRDNQDVITRERRDLQPIWLHSLLSESAQGMLYLENYLAGRLKDILNRHAPRLGLRGGRFSLFFYHILSRNTVL
jgi:hypothetical protein